MPLMHSEDISDHHLMHDKLTQMQGTTGEAVGKMAGGFKYFLGKHSEIINQFRRYPHRNAVLGRESTPEEEEFLKTNSGF